VKLKLKMRKVYAPYTIQHTRPGLAAAVSIFMHILYAYCKLLSRTTPTSPTAIFLHLHHHLHFQSVRDSEVQRPQAHKCCGICFCPLCLWTLSKFHVRNRHKSYGHILNLCDHHISTLHQVNSLLIPISLFFYTVCGCVLWLRLLSLWHFDFCKAAGDLLLIFCAVY